MIHRLARTLPILQAKKQRRKDASNHMQIRGSMRIFWLVTLHLLLETTQIQKT